MTGKNLNQQTSYVTLRREVTVQYFLDMQTVDFDQEYCH